MPQILQGAYHVRRGRVRSEREATHGNDVLLHGLSIQRERLIVYHDHIANSWYLSRT